MRQDESPVVDYVVQGCKGVPMVPDLSTCREGRVVSLLENLEE